MFSRLASFYEAVGQEGAGVYLPPVMEKVELRAVPRSRSETGQSGTQNAYWSLTLHHHLSFHTSLCLCSKHLLCARPQARLPDHHPHLSCPGHGVQMLPFESISCQEPGFRLSAERGPWSTRLSVQLLNHTSAGLQADGGKLINV